MLILCLLKSNIDIREKVVVSTTEYSQTICARRGPSGPGCKYSLPNKIVICYRSHRITPEQVRLLLFKECDWRGRKLLFDSATIEKVPVSKNDKASVKQPVQVPYVVEVSNGYSYLVSF